MVAAAALPWHRSGAVRRTGFELARSVERAGLVTAGWQRALVVAVALLPLLAGAVLLALAAGRPRVGAGLTLASGAVGLASAAVVARTPGGRQPGPAVAVVAAVVAVGCALHLGRKGTG